MAHRRMPSDSPTRNQAKAGEMAGLDSTYPGDGKSLAREPRHRFTWYQPQTDYPHHRTLVIHQRTTPDLLTPGWKAVFERAATTPEPTSGSLDRTLRPAAVQLADYERQPDHRPHERRMQSTEEV